MRHDPRLPGDKVEQPGIYFNTVHRGQPKPGQSGDMPQYPLNQLAKIGLARQIVPVTGYIHTSKHHLWESLTDQFFDMIDNHACGYGPTIASPERNDAKCAAMVAPVLDLNKCASFTRKG